MSIVLFFIARIHENGPVVASKPAKKIGPRHNILICSRVKSFRVMMRTVDRENSGGSLLISDLNTRPAFETKENFDSVR